MGSEPERTADGQARAPAVADPDLPSMGLPAELLLEVYQHARECYPEEACGLLVGPKGGPPARIERCHNVQDRRKLLGESELDARHGYWIDEKELMLALQRAEREGQALQVVYHSHVDTGAYFSHADLVAALGPEGLPLWPGVAQLVVAVYHEGVRDAAYFTWDEEARRFVGRAVAQVS